jgi:hypothetical protein|tara:strand:- start:857 stop:1096 length:240 start_codon:yes stop_codon:yes gene_type:complete
VTITRTERADSPGLSVFSAPEGGDQRPAEGASTGLQTLTIILPDLCIFSTGVNLFNKPENNSKKLQTKTSNPTKNIEKY